MLTGFAALLVINYICKFCRKSRSRLVVTSGSLAQERQTGGNDEHMFDAK